MSVLDREPQAVHRYYEERGPLGEMQSCSECLSCLRGGQTLQPDVGCKLNVVFSPLEKMQSDMEKIQGKFMYLLVF